MWTEVSLSCMVPYSNVLLKISLTFGSVWTVWAVKLGFLPTFQSQMSVQCVLPTVYFTTVATFESFISHIWPLFIQWVQYVWKILTVTSMKVYHTNILKSLRWIHQHIFCYTVIFPWCIWKISAGRNIFVRNLFEINITQILKYVSSTVPPTCNGYLLFESTHFGRGKNRDWYSNGNE